MLLIAWGIHNGPSLGTLPPCLNAKLKYICFAHRKHPYQAHQWMAAEKKWTHPLPNLAGTRKHFKQVPFFNFTSLAPPLLCFIKKVPSHPMEKAMAMAPHSSSLAWEIPWTEEPSGLQFMESLRVGHNWATSLSLFTFMHWRRKWQPTPVLLPGKSHGQRSLVGYSPWGHWGSDTTERLYFHFSLSCIGEGNGNPLQGSCLENPRDRGSLVGCHLWGHPESDTTEVT